MRKIVLSIAAAGAALAAASPAAAQYYPQPQPYGYGYGNGFGGRFGEARELHARIDRIEQQIGWLESNGRLGDWRANGLRREAHELERRLGWEARDGLNPYEARDIQFRISRLEQQVRYSASYGYGRNGDDRRDRDDRWGDRDRD